MLLSKLEWTGHGNLAHAFFNVPIHPGQIGVIWRLIGGKTYTIVDREIPPRRQWLSVDELTAECILIELTKSPHDAEDHPER